MKIVIAVLAVMPMLAHAAPAAALDLPRRPLINRPHPNPPCGDYIDECGRKPWEIVSLNELKARTAGLSASISEGKMDKAGESLDALFTGAGSKVKASEAPAVAAGVRAASPRWVLGVRKGRDPLAEREHAVPAPSFRNVACGDKDGCKSELGKRAEDFVDAVTKPIEKWVERDRTQESRDTYGGCRMKGTCPK